MSFNYDLPTYEQNEVLYVRYSMNCNNGSLSDKTVIVITKVNNPIWEYSISSEN